jgi:hypothetical protein
LYVAGEVVAAQRVNRAVAGTSANEPDLIVRDVLAVEGRDDLAIVVCEEHGLLQGYALLLQLGTHPPEELIWFNGEQCDYIDSVSTEQTADGALITVRHKTCHGNDSGTETVVVRPDNSLRWIETLER